MGIATQTEELETKLLGLATTDEQDAEHTQYANRIRLKAKQRDARTKIRELRGVISATMTARDGEMEKREEARNHRRALADAPHPQRRGINHPKTPIPTFSDPNKQFFMTF